MKKFAVLALAAMMVMAFTIPAAAELWFGPEIGGEMKIYGLMQKNMQGYDSDESAVREFGTRWGGYSAVEEGDYDDFTGVIEQINLYLDVYIGDWIGVYTAFEIESVWGSNAGTQGGDDGWGLVGSNNAGGPRVISAWIQLYPDEYLLDVGKIWVPLSRGFMGNDYFTGINFEYYDLFGSGIGLELVWVKEYEGKYSVTDTDWSNNDDIDQYYMYLKFAPTDEMTLNPFYMFYTGDETGTAANQAWADGGYPTIWSGDMDIHYLGFDWDWEVESDVAFGLWATFIKEFGELTNLDWAAAWEYGGRDVDMTGWLAAIGGNYFVAAGDYDIDLHGQIFYATGDDPTTRDEFEGFTPPTGASYYWAEILGYGRMDQIDTGWQNDWYHYAGNNQLDFNNGMGYVTNTVALNLGTSSYLTPKIQAGLDLWYVMLDEDDTYGNSDLGTEVDAYLTYELVDECFITLVGAYLFTGDAIYDEGAIPGNPSQENMYELGLMLTTATW